MNFYIDISMLPTCDITYNFLCSVLYKKIHSSLITFKKCNTKQPLSIGVALPEYQEETRSVGTKIRILSLDKKSLEVLNLKDKLKSFSNYIHYTNIQKVPEGISKFYRFKRVQFRSKKQIATRKAKRSGISLTAALEELGDFKKGNIEVTLPYVQMTSSSKDLEFPLYIKKESVSKLLNKGFSTYGLSSLSSLPDF